MEKIKKKVLAAIICIVILTGFAFTISSAESLEDYLIRAQKLGNHGQFDEAVAESEKAIEHFPDSVTAYEKLIGFLIYQVPINYRSVKKKMFPGGPLMDSMEFMSPEELKPEYDKIYAKNNEIKEKITARLQNEPESAFLHYILGLCFSNEANVGLQFKQAENMYNKNYTDVPKKDEDKIARAMK